MKPEYLQLLVTRSMPFGKYQGRLLADLPGDYLVKDAGVLVLEVNTVERKGRTLYAGVNGGFQLHIEPAFYQLPLVPVPVRAASPRARLQPTTIAGHINEALDILHAGAPLPPLANGDLLAFLRATTRVTMAELAELYGVGETTASCVVRGLTYPEAGGPVETVRRDWPPSDRHGTSSCFSRGCRRPECVAANKARCCGCVRLRRCSFGGLVASLVLFVSR
jgi:hypothetical protein